MATWIRFRYDNGDSALINAEETHLFFKSDESNIEVLPLLPQAGEGGQGLPLMVYQCEYPDQVSAAEELIFDALIYERLVSLGFHIVMSDRSLKAYGLTLVTEIRCFDALPWTRTSWLSTGASTRFSFSYGGRLVIVAGVGCCFVSGRRW